MGDDYICTTERERERGRCRRGEGGVRVEWMGMGIWELGNWGVG